MSTVENAPGKPGRTKRSSPEAHPLSLEGKAGEEVARNLARVATGQVKPSELGPGYFVAADGTVGIEVDSETFDQLTHRK